MCVCIFFTAMGDSLLDYVLVDFLKFIILVLQSLAQWLGTLIALTENPDWVPRTPHVTHSHLELQF